MIGLFLQKYCQKIAISQVKQELLHIERDNSNTRPNLGRFTRKTKVVSKSEAMVELSIRLWYHLRKSKTLEKKFQSLALSIYK